METAKVHIDLFSGLGGFAFAAEKIWGKVDHVFCDIDPFCRAVLKNHWPNSKIYEDIREFIADAERQGQLQSKGCEQKEWQRISDCYILTGGFPCQPFSQAGRRRGTKDDRYLWPEMFRLVELLKPKWVIAENVRGLTNWNDGMVLEQVCTDLESQGYEVQPFIIPAVAVNAPHRRDRVWIIANCQSERHGGRGSQKRGIQTRRLVQDKQKGSEARGKSQGRISQPNASNAISDNDNKPKQRVNEEAGRIPQNNREKYSTSGKLSRADSAQGIPRHEAWDSHWLETAPILCPVDDGLSDRLVQLPNGEKISYKKWRHESIKAGGNAIVPQVAEQIMKSIKKIDL